MIERLSQFIKYQGISVRSFEQAIGASDGMIRRAINNHTDIQSKWLSIIADIYPHVSIDWLITGRGSMQREETKQPDISRVDLITSKSDFVRIPIVDISVAAGSGYNNPDYIEEVEFISLPESMIKDGNVYLCVRVKGQSMLPSILDGGYLIIRKVDRCEFGGLRDNYVYVVSDTEGRAYVKRIKNRLRQHGFIVCMSDNADKQNYPNFNIYEEDLNTVWYAEWYFCAKIPNIQETYYRKQAELEDRFDDLATQVQQLTKALNINA